MLLALLVINANRVVTTDRILEELWGEDAAGKENALWVYISRLRSALGDENTVVTRDHGYSLIVDEDRLDARRFEAAIAEGRAALRQDPERAASLLTEGLGLWRGPALEEFEYEDFAQSEIRRLEELRLTALEDRIDADLRRGLAGELVSELEVLHRTHPTRERIVHQLMLALYRAGRQSEALRAFETYRLHLAEELGLDPSPELQRLEEQILLHDSRIQGRATDRAHSPLARSGAANPFKGLRAFHEDDGASFFGRDRLVADIIRRLDSGTSLIGLVGPSGSGKSSVARAGLIPALRKGAIEGSDRWVFAHMVPGAHPFAELEAALLRSSLDAPDSLSDQLADPETGILRSALRILPDDQTRPRARHRPVRGVVHARRRRGPEGRLPQGAAHCDAGPAPSSQGHLHPAGRLLRPTAEISGVRHRDECRHRERRADEPRRARSGRTTTIGGGGCRPRAGTARCPYWRTYSDGPAACHSSSTR